MLGGQGEKLGDGGNTEEAKWHYEKETRLKDAACSQHKGKTVSHGILNKQMNA